MDSDNSRIKFFLEVGWARAAIIGWCVVPSDATLFSIHHTHATQAFFGKRLPPVTSTTFNRNSCVVIGPYSEGGPISPRCCPTSFGGDSRLLRRRLDIQYKGVQVNFCSLRPSHRLLEMGSFLGIAHVLFLSLVVSAVVAGNGRKCQNPKVRREWRSLTTSERADWIRAINVLISWFSHCSSTNRLYLVSRCPSSRSQTGTDCSAQRVFNPTRQLNQLSLRRYAVARHSSLAMLMCLV